MEKIKKGLLYIMLMVVSINMTTLAGTGLSQNPDIFKIQLGVILIVAIIAIKKIVKLSLKIVILIGLGMLLYKSYLLYM